MKLYAEEEKTLMVISECDCLSSDSYINSDDHISFGNLGANGMLVRLICDNCGKEFDREPSKVVSEHVFCSLKCSSEFRKKELIVFCDTCGKLMVRREYQIRAERNYCSKECWAEGMKGEKVDRFIQVCRFCGLNFQVTEADLKHRRHEHCSKDCYLRDRNIKVECLNCGLIFAIKRHEIDEGRGIFCSRECDTRYKVGERNPRWKGGYGRYKGPNWFEQQRKALERDGYICQHCGKFQGNKNPIVHHIIPFREFGIERYEEANRLENLITLCDKCHPKLEGKSLEEIIGMERAKQWCKGE